MILGFLDGQKEEANTHLSPLVVFRGSKKQRAEQVQESISVFDILFSFRVSSLCMLRYCH